MNITDNFFEDLIYFGFIDELDIELNCSHIHESYSKHLKTLNLTSNDILNTKYKKKSLSSFLQLIRFCGSCFENGNNIENLNMVFYIESENYGLDEVFENAFIEFNITKDEFYDILYKFIVENNIVTVKYKEDIKGYQDISSLLNIEYKYCFDYDCKPNFDFNLEEFNSLDSVFDVNENYDNSYNTEKTLNYFSNNLFITTEGLEALKYISEENNKQIHTLNILIEFFEKNNNI